MSISVVSSHPTKANACITREGSLTPNFAYIEALSKRAANAQYDMKGDPHILLRINVSTYRERNL